MNRPSYCDDVHLEYLDDLRESGVVNMLGARTYILNEYPFLSPAQAGKVLSYWMKSFGKGDR